ncbi:endonuclease MutS2 [Fusibacter tunisiensis]|uniref:Endonuclease MutS2 n=1 Tax=Fusibacter tunisiensis TaxID=1008308 RepID=A0ABS2MSA0_9FIRM|nr:endonuclease MutS2 [Fusibacter tunisiensis]MBM7562276.1 DNA mismatch repair protein MutS2 [Fusibacter tunisiensis]
MKERTLRVLEYTKIMTMLSGKATSTLGKTLCETLKPEKAIDSIREMQNETSEAVDMMIQFGTPPIGPIYNQENSLKMARIGGVLSPKQLMEIGDSLRTARVLKKYMTTHANYAEKYSILSNYGSSLHVLSELEKEIERCIVSETEVSDHASPELKRIRRTIESKNASIRSKLESMITSATYQKYLQDTLVTIRQDRFVIPVKSEHKNQVKGLVHDQSAKGSTVYIEPIAVVELNNELRNLKLDEAKEIERILRVLTGFVADNAVNLELNMRTLGQLDFIFAKGKLSLEMKAVKPELSNKLSFRIKNGRHPLLPKDEVVPSNVWLGDQFNTLLITGPNTGGKTVTLKTVGLLTLMAQAGLHVPADYGTEIAVFDQIFADIGDEQSIEQSLSTFSSHMTNIVSILKEITPESLVLFDELGAGTDPTEGAALAMAILDELGKRKIRTLATTHYSELKTYAISNSWIENASVEFDVESLSPTYKLLIGIPGKSNAFEISRKLGLGNGLIEQAKAYVHQDNIEFEDIIASIEKSRKIAEAERNEATRLKLEVEKLKSSLSDKEDKWLLKRDEMMRKAREEAKDILRNAKNEVDEIVKSMREIKKTNANDKNKEIERMRKRLQDQLGNVADQVIDADAESDMAPENVIVGDSVRVLSINQEGTVLTLPNEKGELTVQVGLMKMGVNIKQLVLISKKKKDASVYNKLKQARASSMSIHPEIDVRGENLEDAILKVDKYLDDAALSSLSHVRIIHGKGTGVLRKGLQDHFRGHPHVKHYEFAAYNEGGNGATVIELK